MVFFPNCAYNEVPTPEKEFKMIDAALDMLIELLNDGWEYPDAEWKVSRVMKVGSSELADAYDSYCMKH